MGPLYIYAITTRAGAQVWGRTGVEGAPLLSLPYRDIAAVVSPLTAARVEATPANVCVHEEIVEAQMQRSAVLPMRWGTVLPGLRQLFAVLEAYYTAFVAALERVQTRVELGLRVLWDDDIGRAPSAESARAGASGPAAGPGRQYLMLRVEEDRRARAERQRALGVVENIHRPLSRLAAESVREVLLTPRMLLAAAYLVDRERVDAFRAEAHALALASPALRFLLTGPWPPYHFVTDCVPAEALLAEHPPSTEHTPQWRGGG